jgi:hypothetical protein
MSLSSDPRVIRADSQFVWVLTSTDVSRINPSSNTIDLTIKVPSTSQSIAASGGRLFVVDSAGAVLSFDAATGRSLASTDTVTEPSSIAASDNAVAVVDFATSSVFILDPATLNVSAKVVTNGNASVAFGGGYFWVTSASFGTLSKLDTEGQIVDTFQVAKGAPAPTVFYQIAADDTVLVIRGDVGIYRIDPATDRVQPMIGVPNIIGAVVDPESGTVWAMTGGNKIQPITP